jgi:hypothetical protein
MGAREVPLRRVRYTVRRLKVSVAVAAVVLGGLAYPARLAEVRRAHRRGAAELPHAEQAYRHPSYRDQVEDPVAADRPGRLAEKFETADRPRLPSAPPRQSPSDMTRSPSRSSRRREVS